MNKKWILTLSLKTNIFENVEQVIKQKHIGIFNSYKDAEIAKNQFSYEDENIKSLEYAENFLSNLKLLKPEFYKYIISASNGYKCIEKSFTITELAKEMDWIIIKGNSIILMQDFIDITNSYDNPYFMTHGNDRWIELSILPVGE